MKEKPRKRLRVPPNSATREERGKMSSSTSTLVNSDREQREKVKKFEENAVLFFSL